MDRRITSWQAGGLLSAHLLARALICFTVPGGLFPALGLAYKMYVAVSIAGLNKVQLFRALRISTLNSHSS